MKTIDTGLPRGGSPWVEQEVHHGARSAAKRLRADLAQSRLASEAAAAGQRPHAMQTVKTYIVEDSPIILENLVEALEQFTPVEVVGFAADEASALAWLMRPENRCDLIVIDLFLKSGSGLDVLARAAEAGVTGRRVVLTNYATSDLRRRCLELGADCVFDKSREVDELIAYCGCVAEGGGNTKARDLRDH